MATQELVHFFSSGRLFFQLNNVIHVKTEGFHGNMSMLEAFYFGKGKPPEASQEEEIFQLVWFSWRGSFGFFCLFVCGDFLLLLGFFVFCLFYFNSQF